MTAALRPAAPAAEITIAQGEDRPCAVCLELLPAGAPAIDAGDRGALCILCAARELAGEAAAADTALVLVRNYPAAGDRADVRPGISDISEPVTLAVIPAVK